MSAGSTDSKDSAVSRPRVGTTAWPHGCGGLRDAAREHERAASGRERQTHEVVVAESRERIGAEALQAAWAEGRAMATDDAVVLALA